MHKKRPSIFAEQFILLFSLLAFSNAAIAGPVPPDDCFGGSIADNGGPFTSGTGNKANGMAQRHTIEGPLTTIETVCINMAGNELKFDIVFYAPDGAGGKPGTELGRFAGFDDGVTGTFTWFQHPVSQAHDGGDVYISIDFQNNDRNFVARDDAGDATTAFFHLPPPEDVDWSSQVNHFAIRALWRRLLPPPPELPIFSDSFEAQ